MANKLVRRRDFLKFSLAGMALATASRLVGKKPARAPEPEEKSPHQWAMVIDQAKCVGCGHCSLACKAHNDVPPSIDWNRIVPTGPVNGQQTYLPVPCMQCGDAPCTHICPVGATHQRGDGIVMMDYERCIGCRYCEMACPYGSRSFNWEAFEGENPAVPVWGVPEVPRRPRGVVEKCSFCFHRIDRGLKQGLKPGVDREATPACVVACPRQARSFGDLNDPESPVSQALADHGSFRLREGLGTEPRVYYLAPRKKGEEEVVS